MNKEERTDFVDTLNKLMYLDTYKSECLQVKFNNRILKFNDDELKFANEYYGMLFFVYKIKSFDSDQYFYLNSVQQEMKRRNMVSPSGKWIYEWMIENIMKS